MSSTAGAIDTRTAQPAELNRHLRAAIWLAVVALMLCLAMLLTWRRIAGALTEPFTGFELIVAAVMLLVVAAWLRWSAPSFIGMDLTLSLPGAAAFMLLAAVTLPGTPAWGVVSAWLTFVVVEVPARLWRYRPAGGFRPFRFVRPPAGDDSQFVADEPVSPAGLVQQLTRVREDDRESIHALFETHIAAGDRLGVAHLAFCPPLAARPELTAHAVDGAEAEVRITQIETFGARLEVRLTQAADQPRRILAEAIGSAIVPPES